jgi:hypothetical protein
MVGASSDWLMLFSSQTFSRMNTPIILHTYLPRKMEQTECSKTLAYKIQTRGFTQKKAYNSTVLMLMSCLVLYMPVYPGPKGCQIWFSTY